MKPPPDPRYRHRFPAEIIGHVVWLCHVFSLSLRDVELLLAERGIIVSYETVRLWCKKFAESIANRLRRRRPRTGDRWHMDEVFIRIQGVQHYLWRAVDQDGVVLDILVQKRRDGQAARFFFRRLLKGPQYVPRVIVTDSCEATAWHSVIFSPVWIIGKADISTIARKTRIDRRDVASARCNDSNHGSTLKVSSLPQHPRSLSSTPQPNCRQRLSFNSVGCLQGLATGDVCAACCLIDINYRLLSTGHPNKLNVTMPAILLVLLQGRRYLPVPGWAPRLPDAMSVWVGLGNVRGQ
jgi:transposase-like protein